MNCDHFWLTDRQFARIALPTDTRGKPRVDDRRVISGIARGAGGAVFQAPLPEAESGRMLIGQQ